jgi:hypothetical protein
MKNFLNLISLLSCAALALLIRFVDDFLYLTTSLPQAIEFVTRMHRGFPEFGCIVNKNKTLVNFDFEEDGHPLRKCPIDYGMWSRHPVFL